MVVAVVTDQLFLLTGPLHLIQCFETGGDDAEHRLSYTERAADNHAASLSNTHQGQTIKVCTFYLEADRIGYIYLASERALGKDSTSDPTAHDNCRYADFTVIFQMNFQQQYQVAQRL